MAIQNMGFSYKRLIITALLVLILAVGLKCYQDPIDISIAPEVENCSKETALTYKKIPNALFRQIYGEYIYQDTLSVLINPDGKFFCMKKYSPNYWGIYNADYYIASISNSGHIILTTKTTRFTPIKDTILYCSDNIWVNGDTTIWRLICKCTL